MWLSSLSPIYDQIPMSLAELGYLDDVEHFWNLAESNDWGLLLIWTYMGDEHTPLMLSGEGGDSSLIPGPLSQGNTRSGIGPIVQHWTPVQLSTFKTVEYSLGNIMKNDTYGHKNSWETLVTKCGCIRLKACNLQVAIYPKHILNENHISPFLDLSFRWLSQLYPLFQGMQSPLVSSRPFSLFCWVIHFILPLLYSHIPFPTSEVINRLYLMCISLIFYLFLKNVWFFMYIIFISKTATVSYLFRMFSAFTQQSVLVPVHVIYVSI